jgi:hypothetical protein
MLIISGGDDNGDLVTYSITKSQDVTSLMSLEFDVDSDNVDKVTVTVTNNGDVVAEKVHMIF